MLPGTLPGRDVLRDAETSWRVLRDAPHDTRVRHGHAQHCQLLLASGERRQEFRRHRRVHITAGLLHRHRKRTAEAFADLHVGR